jgi:hypothetical protein
MASKPFWKQPESDFNYGGVAIFEASPELDTRNSSAGFAQSLTCQIHRHLARLPLHTDVPSQSRHQQAVVRSSEHNAAKQLAS